jgi:hypothetical protein
MYGNDTKKETNMHDEIKRGINSGNGCCLSVQNFSICLVRK